MFSGQKCFKTGVYRTNGSVDKWKFRITLKKIYSLIEIPRFDQSNEDDPFEDTSNNAEEQLDIAWQEKVFSQSEIEYYSVRENCTNDLHKSYHHTINSAELTKNENGRKIYSYTTADNYAPDDEISSSISATQLRREQEDCIDSMFIMADIKTEVVLFTLKWNSRENILLVYPDFNCMNINPYYKEVQGDSRQMYHFGIKNLSSKLKLSESKETFQLDATVMDKLNRLTLREEMFRDNFSYPENHQLQLMVLLDILSGRKFSYDNTHVRFTIGLPTDSKLIHGLNDGCTHSSKKTNGTWQYSHCHELLLKVPENHKIGDCIRFYFEIISIDTWKRERLLGNAQITVPLRAQVLESSLTCLKIANNQSFYDKLEAFLVGGRRTVNLNEFYGNNDVTLLNRYGSRAEFAGELDIRCQIVQQQRPQIVQLFGRNTKKHGKFRANVVTIEELLSSYQRARERLEEIINLKY